MDMVLIICVPPEQLRFTTPLRAPACASTHQSLSTILHSNVHPARSALETAIQLLLSTNPSVHAVSIRTEKSTASHSLEIKKVQRI